MVGSKLIEGFWWLPERQHEKQPGVLEISKRGDIRLRLFGWLFPEEPSGMIHQKPDIIIGESSGFPPITLVRCYVISGPTRRGNEILGSELGAISAHFGSLDVRSAVIAADRLRVAYSDTSAWRIPRPFKKLSARSLKALIAGTAPTILQPTRPVVLYRGEFSLAYVEAVRHHAQEGVYFSGMQPLLEIRSRAKRPIEDFLPIVISLGAFLSFINRHRIRHEAVQYRRGQRALLNPWISIEGHFAGPLISAEQMKDNTTRHADRLATLPDVRTEFPFMLSKWMDEYETFLPVYNLFLSAIDEHETVDGAVFQLAQASEAFHNRLHHRNDRIEDAVTSMVRNVYSNMAEHVGDAEAFGRSVMKVRHYYAHYSRRSGTYPFSPEELAETLRKLRIVFEANLLKWMGMNDKQIRRCLRNVWAYHFA